MHRPTAAALVVAVAALVAPTPATAAAPPGELWSEFPLEPPAATTPAPAAPSPAVKQPEQAQDDASETFELPTGLLILLGAAAAVAAGFMGRHAWREQAAAEEDPKREPAAVRTVEPPVTVADDGGTAGPGRMVLAGRAASFTATRTTPTLIETLSPQARLADQLEQTEVDIASEAHETCEIACWRGYVTWQFYAESERPVETLFSSPAFRAPGKGAPKQTAAALRAHELLVEKLISAGWGLQGYGEDWFAARFQRARRLPSA